MHSLQCLQMSLPLIVMYWKENLLQQGLSHYTDLLSVCKKKDKGKAVLVHAMSAHGGQWRYSSINS
jgi:hypothetical protein